ncbi:hypothetical protein [Amycolatopsis lurida]|uniref:hypothetical protein n=1 Tax=Amycolatopsis lurida TaxID=31959 RepID=UPI00364DAC0E
MNDTRTCAMPGDHEHDHEMCNDVVIGRIEDEILAGIADLDDVTLGLLLKFGLLLDLGSLRNEIAVQVLRDRLHENAAAEYEAVRNLARFDDRWRASQRSGADGAPHGKACPCCSAGVAQWR